MTRRTEYRAHPAYLLRFAGSSGRGPTPEAELGPRWLKLSREERRRRERAFFALLLERLGAELGATFAATFRDLGAAEAFADTWGLRRGGYDVSGASRPDVAAALADETLDSVRLSAGGTPLLTLADGWNGVRVWLDDVDKPTWSRDLRAAIRLPDDETAAGEGHPVRAWLLFAVSHLTWIVSALLAIGSIRLLDESGVPLPIAIAIGAVLLVVLALWPASRIHARAARWVLGDP